GAHPLIKRFLKGISRLRPPKPRYEHTWNPQQVLEYFSSQLPNNAELNLLQLSQKLVMLLALISGHRLQTLATIRVACVAEQDDGYKIFIPDQLKHWNPR